MPPPGGGMEDIMKKIIALLTVCCILASSLCLFPVGAASEDPSDSYTYIKAPNEDATLDLWFDYASKKISPDNVTPTGMECFSVYMAKNEIEDAQFVLLADSDRSGMTAEIDGFKNENGDTLSADEERKLLRRALERLNSREREIMRLRYGLSGADELTQKEVADLMGISQSYISRLEKKIITNLRKNFFKPL